MENRMFGQLEKDGPLTEHDVEFLRGNEEYYRNSPASLNIVHEWCRNNGLGEFGDPTPKGKRMMKLYEQQ